MLVYECVCVCMCVFKLEFHNADTDTDTDILAEFRARIVHEPDTHDNPRRLVRHAARFSSRGCPLGMCASRPTRVLYTISYSVYTFKKLHDRRIPNVGVGIRVGPMELRLISLVVLLACCVLCSFRVLLSK